MFVRDERQFVRDERQFARDERQFARGDGVSRERRTLGPPYFSYTGTLTLPGCRIPSMLFP